MSEFNSIKTNNSASYKGSNKYAANFVPAGKNVVATQNSLKEQNQAKDKTTETKQKSQNLAKLLTTFVGMVSAATVIVGVDTILPTTKYVEVQEFYASSYETDVFYYLSLGEDYDPESDVYVVLYNDFTNREEKIEEQGWEGTFENLKENMTYTIAVKQGNKVLVSQKVKTETPEKYEEEYYEEDPITSDDPTNSDDPGNATSGGN